MHPERRSRSGREVFESDAMTIRGLPGRPAQSVEAKEVETSKYGIVRFPIASRFPGRGLELYSAFVVRAASSRNSPGQKMAIARVCKARSGTSHPRVIAHSWPTFQVCMQGRLPSVRSTRKWARRISLDGVHEETANWSPCIARRTVDDVNPAWPYKHYATIIPRVLVHELMQDFQHQQYLPRLDSSFLQLCAWTPFAPAGFLVESQIKKLGADQKAVVKPAYRMLWLFMCHRIR